MKGLNFYTDRARILISARGGKGEVADVLVFKPGNRSFSIDMHVWILTCGFFGQVWYYH